MQVLELKKPISPDAVQKLDGFEIVASVVSRILLDENIPLREFDYSDLIMWICPIELAKITQDCLHRYPANNQNDWSEIIEEDDFDEIFSSPYRIKKIKHFRKSLAKAFKHQCWNPKIQEEWTRIFDRIHELTELFDLKNLEIRILAQRIVEDGDEGFAGLLQRIKAPGSSSANLVKVAYRLEYGLGESLREILGCLSPSGALQVNLLLDDDGDLYKGALEYCLGLSSEFVGEERWVKMMPSALDLSDTLLTQDESEILCAMLRNKTPDQPLNILFYGSPGTGKTELAKILSHYWSGNTYSFLLEEDDSTRSDRLRHALVVAERKLNPQKDLLVLDEVEQILATNDLRTKRFINPLLERSKIAKIWIVNHTDQMDSSTLRRFDFSLCFGAVDASRRAQLLRNLLDQDPRWKGFWNRSKLEDLCSRYPVSIGTLGLVHRYVSPHKKNPKVVKRKIELLLQKQCELMDLQFKKPLASVKISLDGLAIAGELGEILDCLMGFTKHLEECVKSTKQPQFPNMNLLLSGPPGTGKTEYAKYLAQELKRPLMIKKASDLLGSFVGQSEKSLRDAFAEAEKTQSLLLLDEADSFFAKREGAHRNWEVTQVNELLQQMENFKGVLICATNHESNFDMASLRRFAFRVHFQTLDKAGVVHFFKLYLAEICADFDVNKLEKTTVPSGLCPGDFKVLKQRLFFSKRKLGMQEFMVELQNEALSRDQKKGRKIGF